MKISPVLPIAFSCLLTASLAAPLRLRYPSPAEAEKRADTFLQPKTPSLDEKIHQTLNFGAGEPLMLRDVEKNAKRADPLDQSSDSAGTSSASSGSNVGSIAALGSSPTTSFDQAIHDTLDFGGPSDPLLFKKDAAPQVEKRSSDSFDQTIHEQLDFGGVTDPLLFKKDAPEAVEKRQSLPDSSSLLPTTTFDNAIHQTLDFGGTTDPLLGSSSGSLSLFRRAEEAIEGAARSVARAFHA